MSDAERKARLDEVRMAIHAECGWCRDRIPRIEGWKHRQHNGQLNMCLASAHLHKRIEALDCVEF